MKRRRLQQNEVAGEGKQDANRIRNTIEGGTIEQLQATLNVIPAYAWYSAS